MRELARIDGEIIASGVYPDHDAQSAPLYVDSSNILFANRKAVPFPGGLAKFTPDSTATVIGIEAVRIAGLKKIFYGSVSALKSWDETNGIVSQGTGYTGAEDQTDSTDATLWRIIQWGAWVIATNGIDAPQIWKGTSFATLGGLGTEFGTAQEFVKWRQYLIAVNLDVGANKVAWCDTNNPEAWTPTASNDAGSLFIRDVESDLRAARLLNDAVLMYSHNSIHALTYLRSRQVFGSQRLLTGVGAYSKFAVTSFAGKHFGFGPRGIWTTDGVSFDYIHSPAIRDNVLKNINEDQASKIVAYHDARSECIVFFYPSGSSTFNNAGLAFSYRDNSWNPIQLQRSCATDNGIFAFPLTGSVTGTVFDQSVFDVPTSPTLDSDIATPATFTATAGFGHGGFGQLPFGGVLNGTG